MPLYNFKRQFAEAVRSGAKRQTIRARGKRPAPKPGQIAHCYTGLRTHSVCVLGHYVIKSVTPISISAASRTVSIPTDNQWRAMWDYEVDQLARADGFATVDEFFAFFQSEHGGTFSGYLVKWEAQ
jgi:hypothetical protein